MRVYRIETTDGDGLYGAYEGGSDYENSLAARLAPHFAFSEIKHQPAPSEDGLSYGWNEPGKIYGFVGAMQMKNWIGDCPIELIYVKGGQVVVLDVRVDKVECGYSQCRFDPNDVTSRKVLTLQEIQQELQNGNVQRFAA